MVFSSMIFLFVFLPLILISYFIIKNRTYRNLIMLVFSLLFYSWGEPVYVLLMLFSIAINYFIAILMDKYTKYSKLYLVFALLINIINLFIFKYLDFSIDIVNSIFHSSIKSTNIVLPIGISFYTFQILSYVIDVYRKKVKVQKNMLLLGTYISLFPQLIAGPIVRYETVEQELIERKENLNGIASGIRRFIQGLGKKVIIADSIAYVVTSILSMSPANYGFIGVWIGMIAYTLQIYFDFSGYSDMAIGLGQIFGFKFLENFNYPYIAKSITDFWRRWHISLSSFFKDYVYIPLGGSRVSKKRTIINILIVWLLTGLWHGASINFIIWGIYYGIILIIEKNFLKRYLDRIPNIFKHFYTMIIVIIGWGIFRSIDLTNVKDLFASMIGLNGLGNLNFLTFTGIIKIEYILYFIIGIFLCTPIFNLYTQKISNTKYGTYIIDTLLLLVFILSVIYIVIGSYSPFIYFRF